MHHEFFRTVTYISDEDMVFSKNLYFQQEQMDSHYDLYGNEFYYLLEKDATFFDDYIDQLLDNVERGTAKGRKPLSKVWNYPDADNLIHGALVKIRQMKYHNSIDHISSIFFIQLDEDNKLKASRLISRLIQEFKEDLIMLNILLDNLRNYLSEFLDRFIAEILTANPDFEIFKRLVFYNSHFSSTGNQIWAEFKATKLKHVYEVIHSLHNHYDYIEHKDFLANRIADLQETTAFERKLIFRGFR